MKVEHLAGNAGTASPDTDGPAPSATARPASGLQRAGLPHSREHQAPAGMEILNAKAQRREDAIPILNRNLLCSAIAKNHAIPTIFLPQRNAKIAKTRTYVVFSLRSMRSFAANSSLVAALPRCVFATWRLCCVKTSFVSVKSVKSVVQIRNPQSAIAKVCLVKPGQAQSNLVKPGHAHWQHLPMGLGLDQPSGLEDFFAFTVGQSCRSALNSWAAPDSESGRSTEDTKNVVLRPPAIPHIVVCLPKCPRYGGLSLRRDNRRTGHCQFPHPVQSNRVKPSQTISSRNPTGCWSAGVLGFPITPPLHHPIPPSHAIRNCQSVFGQTWSNPVKPSQTRIFHSLAGRSCCFALIQGGSRFGIGTPYRTGCGMLSPGI